MTTTIKYKNKGLTSIWEELVLNYAGITAVIDRYSDFELTYKELHQLILDFASGLQSMGLKKDDHVCLFSENSAKWLVADQAVLMCGAVNAVRSSQAPTEELLYILNHSDSTVLIAENLATVEKLKDYSLNFIICLSDENILQDNVYSFKDVVALGKKQEFNPVEIEKDDLATLVYTSGTTGKPKGVMLTHGNLLSQITALVEPLGISPGDKALNMLPTWHTYERTCEYYLLSRGVTMAYTNVINFKEDIKRYNHHFLVSVPRIWEALHSGIHTELKKLPYTRQKLARFLLKTSETHIKARRILTNMTIDGHNNKLHALVSLCATYPAYKLGEKLIFKKIRSALGKNFKQGISGGGALAGYLENFYETVGINITVGYGLTETSPVLTLRKRHFNLRNSAGKPIPGTEIKIQDGVVFARGAQIMKGYYKDQQATNEILSPDGWLNTGDMGWLTPENDLILTGRCKDIIVLSNGENIEPQPLEDALLQSPYISQVMLIGQDQAHLGALIVLNPEASENPGIEKILKKELKEHIQKRPNFRTFEAIKCFRIIDEPFSIENGLLTRTMKVKKPEVYKKYSYLVDEMFR
ncbi:MAG: hypothetical protein A2Y25_00330 [Candidatus Melainabacteria bacterium GWF2_37_15]|nr:MAG: hypothetical protein A2Y25_00330 [Candidatus Melainabacteria bacterium GWF2_37_15]